MDEEAPKPKKITAANFFESIISVQSMANRALTQSEENLASIKSNDDLLKGIQESIQLMEEDISNITNYFIIQQENRQKLLELREQDLAKQEDQIQKQLDEREKGLDDQKSKSFGESIRQGAASVFQSPLGGSLLTAGAALGLNALARLTGFEEGGEPPINQPAIVGEGGPEIFVPKTSGVIIPNNIANNFANNFLSQNNKKINVQALLNTISEAEGTGKGGYGTIYGGTDDNPITVPELAEGKMTIKQVLDMMRTGKIERSRMVENDEGEMVEEKYMADVGYGKENNVGATGRYQFIPEALEEEVGVMMGKDENFSYDTLFTPEIQDKLILQRLKEKRNIDFDKLNKEGITTAAIDKLSEEFESFPNLLPGPRKDDLGPVKGRTDQSFYDVIGNKAPVRSEEYIKSVFENEVEKLTPPPDEDLSSITLPPIGDTGGSPELAQSSPPFDISSNETDELTETESEIPFIDVISNPFLSVV